uniref:Cytochrome c oxidase subunit 2 n=1 Tax=Acanthocardia tuberculata TaxID=385555 RepID=Q06SA7_ACATU|nr:cytochrome c oxidase subunit II [Acanthocardia tuberculata]ABF60131.1 cytochrome c oxidase subunit 2 [Acanthocardia tuberculata]
MYVVWDKQYTFHDPVTDNLAYMILYHGCVMTVCGGVLTIVMSGFLYVVYCGVSGESFSSLYTSSDLAETLWTFIPMVVLLALCFPSLTLLYYGALRCSEYEVNLKVTGHQWYWQYEYQQGSDELVYESYLLPAEEANERGGGMFQYMDVDKRCVLPSDKLIRVLFTSEDVIHSWFIPSFGLKNDCVPGRVGSASLVIKEPGVYYGFCTELCGVLHSEMPIAVEVVPSDVYDSWLSNELNQ